MKRKLILRARKLSKRIRVFKNEITKSIETKLKEGKEFKTRVSNEIKDNLLPLFLNSLDNKEEFIIKKLKRCKEFKDFIEKTLNLKHEVRLFYVTEKGDYIYHNDLSKEEQQNANSRAKKYLFNKYGINY